MQKVSFGKDGDFITAPHISKIFSEIYLQLQKIIFNVLLLIVESHAFLYFSTRLVVNTDNPFLNFI